MALLRILNGMHAGRAFELTPPQTVLGRTRECDIVLATGKVSRKHARILQDDDHFYVEDLGSRNGTFVNGERVDGRRPLTDRDRIQLADFVLSFHEEPVAEEDSGTRNAHRETPAPSSDSFPATDDSETPLPTIMTSLDALAHLRTDRNPAEKLRAMHEIINHLGSSLEIDELLIKVLDSLFRVFLQADRGYVLLADEHSGRLETRAMKMRYEDPGATMTIRPVSRTISSAVMSEGKALLSSDVMADQRFRKSGSVLDFEVRCMISAPLIGPSRTPLGLIYLDTLDPDREFAENDLDVLVSVAALAGQAVEFARVHQALLAERRQAEETLRASEMRFRAVWENSADAMRLTDENGIILAVNEAYCQIVGLKPEELVGRPFTCVYSQQHDTRELLRKYRQEFRAGSLGGHLENRYTFQSSRQVELSIKRSIIEIEPGNRVVLSIFRDITDRKRTEAALEESEQRFEMIFDEAAIGIAATGLDGTIGQVNPALKRILGYDDRELLGSSLTRYLHAEDHRKLNRSWRALVHGERDEYHMEARLTRSDDRTVWGNLTLSLVRDREDNPMYLIVMLEDISDRKRLEREVADLAVQEQQRIGQELHDDLGQVLTGIGYMSRTLLERLQKQNSTETETARNIAEGLQKALTQVRSIAKGLVPVEIDAEGLHSALGELAANAEKMYGITCRFACERPIRVDDSHTAVHLYHIAQEAITNAFKHGKAKNVSIVLRTADEQLSLEVRDDGVGIKPTNEQPSGIGLRIMRYRAGLIGATIDVQPDPNGGTVVACVLRDVSNS